MSPRKTLVGWREWVALPELGLVAVEAKVDTGAQTSVLHAFAMHVVEEQGKQRVYFGVHPLRDDEALEVFASAEVVDRRVIASSRGQEELRPIIRTPVALGRQTWEIELSLTDRRHMAHRMLLARGALAGRLIVDPGQEYLHGQVPAARSLYQ